MERTTPVNQDAQFAWTQVIANYLKIFARRQRESADYSSKARLCNPHIPQISAAVAYCNFRRLLRGGTLFALISIATLALMYHYSANAQVSASPGFGIIAISKPVETEIEGQYHLTITVGHIDRNKELNRAQIRDLGRLSLSLTDNSNIVLGVPLGSNIPLPVLSKREGEQKGTEVYTLLISLLNPARPGDLTVGLEGPDEDLISSEFNSKRIVWPGSRPLYFGILNRSEPVATENRGEYRFSLTVGDLNGNIRIPDGLLLSVSDEINTQGLAATRSTDRLHEIFEFTVQLQDVLRPGALTVSLAGINRRWMSRVNSIQVELPAFEPLPVADIGIIQLNNPSLTENRGEYRFSVVVGDFNSNIQVPQELMLNITDDRNIQTPIIARSTEQLNEVFEFTVQLQNVFSAGALTVSLAGVEEELVSAVNNSIRIELAASPRQPVLGILSATTPIATANRGEYRFNFVVGVLNTNLQILVNELNEEAQGEGAGPGEPVSPLLDTGIVIAALEQLSLSVTTDDNISSPVISVRSERMNKIYTVVVNLLEPERGGELTVTLNELEENLVWSTQATPDVWTVTLNKTEGYQVSAQHSSRRIEFAPAPVVLPDPRYGIVSVAEPQSDGNGQFVSEITVSDVVGNTQVPGHLGVRVSAARNIVSVITNQWYWANNRQQKIFRVYAQPEVLTSSASLTIAVTGLETGQLSLDDRQAATTVYLPALQPASTARFAILNISQPRLENPQGHYSLNVEVGDNNGDSPVPEALGLDIDRSENIHNIAISTTSIGINRGFILIGQLEDPTRAGMLTISLGGVPQQQLSASSGTASVTFAAVPRYGIISVTEPQSDDSGQYVSEVTVSDVVGNTRVPGHLGVRVSAARNIASVITNRWSLSDDGRQKIFTVYAQLAVLISSASLTIAVTGLETGQLSLDDRQAATTVYLPALQPASTSRFAILNVSQPRLVNPQGHYSLDVEVGDNDGGSPVPEALGLDIDRSENIHNIAISTTSTGINRRFTLNAQLIDQTRAGVLTISLGGVPQQQLSDTPRTATVIFPAMQTAPSPTASRYGIVNITEPWPYYNGLFFSDVTVSDVVGNTLVPRHLGIRVTDSANITSVTTNQWYWRNDGQQKIFRIYAQQDVLTSSSHYTIALDGLEDNQLSLNPAQIAWTFRLRPLRSAPVARYGIVTVTEPQALYDQTYYFDATISDVVSNTQVPQDLSLVMTASENIDYYRTDYRVWSNNGRDKTFRIYARLEDITNSASFTFAVSGVVSGQVSLNARQARRTVSLPALRPASAASFAILSVSPPRLENTAAGRYRLNIKVGDSNGYNPVPEALNLVISWRENIDNLVISAPGIGVERRFILTAQLEDPTRVGMLTVRLGGVPERQIKDSSSTASVVFPALQTASLPQYVVAVSRPQTNNDYLYFFDVTVSDLVSSTRVPESLRVTVRGLENIGYYWVEEQVWGDIDERVRTYRIYAGLLHLSSGGHLAMTVSGIDNTLLSLRPEQNPLRVYLPPLQSTSTARFAILNVSQPRLENQQSSRYIVSIAVGDNIGYNLVPETLRPVISRHENIYNIVISTPSYGVDQRFVLSAQLVDPRQPGVLGVRLAGVPQQQLSATSSTVSVIFPAVQTAPVSRYGIIDVTDPDTGYDSELYYFEVTISDVISETQVPQSARLVITGSENIYYYRTDDWFSSNYGRDRTYRLYAYLRQPSRAGYLTVGIGGIDTTRLSLNPEQNLQMVYLPALRSASTARLAILSVSQPQLEHAAAGRYSLNIEVGDNSGNNQVPDSLMLVINECENIHNIAISSTSIGINWRFTLSGQLEDPTRPGVLGVRLAGVPEQQIKGSSSTVSVAFPAVQTTPVSSYGIVSVSAPDKYYDDLYYFDVVISDVISETQVPQSVSLVMTHSENIGYYRIDSRVWSSYGHDRTYRVYTRQQHLSRGGYLTIALIGLDSNRLSLNLWQRSRMVYLPPLQSTSTARVAILSVSQPVLNVSQPENQSGGNYELYIQVGNPYGYSPLPEALRLDITQCENIHNVAISSSALGVDRLFTLSGQLEDPTRPGLLGVSLGGVPEQQIKGSSSTASVVFPAVQSAPVSRYRIGRPAITLLTSPTLSDSGTQWQFEVRIGVTYPALLPQGIELNVESMNNFVGLMVSTVRTTARSIDYIIQATAQAETHTGMISFGIGGLPQSIQPPESLTVTVESEILERVMTTVADMTEEEDTFGLVFIEELLNEEEQEGAGYELIRIVKAFINALNNPLEQDRFDVDNNGVLNDEDLRLIVRFNFGLSNSRECSLGCRMRMSNLQLDETAAAPVISLVSTITQTAANTQQFMVEVTAPESENENSLPAGIQLVVQEQYHIADVQIEVVETNASALRYRVSAAIATGSATGRLIFSLSGVPADTEAPEQLKVVLKRMSLARATSLIRQLGSERSDSETISLSDLLLGVRATSAAMGEEMLSVNLQVLQSIESNNLQAFMAALQSDGTEEREAFDVNSDGDVDSYDFRLMVRYSSGLRGQSLCSRSCEAKIDALLQ